MDNHSKEIRWLSYHSSSKQLLAAGGDCLISVWDMTRMGTNKGAFVGHTRRVRCVEKLARTSIVSAGDGGMVFVWDTQSAEPVYIFCGHEAPITCLHVADEGRTLITAGKDKRIKLWHLDFST
uniref:Guanine nucleotide-binding protein subunit beta-like protein n=2 Tax=Palpitomonas bilix TaxID=652834 RepID=A0A7S3GDQ6_9EUKA|mmetsp:Transcript_4506/g.9310  ORF Transcript_4506/g.9310 Transcript_4506/m.9310 type:complete len:123 (+) Transcript_4506:131-499(+)